MRSNEIVQKIADIEMLSEGERNILMAAMPHTAADCNTYSALVTFVLMDAMRSRGVDLIPVHDWLRWQYDEQQYRAMHLYLIVGYMSAGISLPPLFLEFAVNNALLKMIMGEMLADIAEYVQEMCIERDGDCHE